MGREIRRVPLDFDCKIGDDWQGFQMPTELRPVDCEACGQTGYNPATRELADRWYDSAGFGVRWKYAYGIDPEGEPADRPPWLVLGRCYSWQYDLTQDEVDELVEQGRLYEFTHEWKPGVGWSRKEGVPNPSAAEVNEWARRGVGHDAINRMICVNKRANRLGFYGKCAVCGGDGSIYRDAAHRHDHDSWEPTEPPVGPAYQVWQTVSEGGPVSPPFLAPDELALWMVANDRSVTRGTSYEQWLSLIVKEQSASSLVLSNTGIKSGVEAMGE